MPFDPSIYASNWTMVALSGIVAVVAIGGMFLANRILSSRRPSATKLSTYECGIEPARFSWSNINLRFYIFAILFLIFDVEAVFPLPVGRGLPGAAGLWATPFPSTRWCCSWACCSSPSSTLGEKGSLNGRNNPGPR